MTYPEILTPAVSKPRHNWLRKIHVSFVPGPLDPVSEETMTGLAEAFRSMGHTVQDAPDARTDVILTTARYGESMNWRKSLMLTARIRYQLDCNPTVFTIVHIRPDELAQLIKHFETALAKSPQNPADFEFDGLSPSAFNVLVEQGLRGGPILAIERIIQAQTKSIRILLVVGEEHPEYAYHFDLVGAYPRSFVEKDNRPAGFYDDIVMRITTTVSTREVTDHEVVGEMIPYEVWKSLDTPNAMRSAALELGKRQFFTDMVRIADLVPVPAVGGAIADQYSEGCFATWEPRLDALIATITGSARPVDKDNITEDELAVLTGVRPGGVGAYVRHVEGKRNDPPSSEAVEMMEMDAQLPVVDLGSSWGIEAQSPVVRSKLHGHRGVSAYDPQFVEYASLEAPYFHYIVSCATEAQAHGVKDAFSRAQALLDPADPRQVVFTVLPGHGMVVVEKWVPGKRPFQLLWEAMDAGHIVIDSHVPQGPIRYVPDADGLLVVEEFE
ncbi:MAG: hypothetical protein J5I90_16190 [Caldilineales bacterium]|nr:hypothetical protein [Caldilineales bacterium]